MKRIRIRRKIPPKKAVPERVEVQQNVQRVKDPKLAQFHRERLAGSALPELGIITPEQEDLIMRTEGVQGLLKWEPDKNKLLNYGAEGRYAYEKRFGHRPGEYTTPEESLRIERAYKPSPSDSVFDMLKVRRKQQYDAFKKGNPLAGMVQPPRGVRQATQRAKQKNPMMYDPAPNAVNPSPVDYLRVDDEEEEYGRYL